MKRIVVKFGSSTLTHGGQKLSKRHMLLFAQQIAALHEQGLEIVIVTSGAVAAGKEQLGLHQNDRNLPKKQMLAAVGQVKLMQVWAELFQLFEISVGQLLLTRGDFSDRKRYLNMRDTVSTLFHNKLLPIVNENDSITTREIKIGDNDNLAALMGNLIAADAVILLTDQEGLYTNDPRTDPDATLIPTVTHIDNKIFALAGGTKSALGTGGMVTKIEAAQVASQSGCLTIIASSSRPNVLLDIIAGKQIGTKFLPEISAIESRKRWLLSGKPEGQLYIDDMAKTKLTHHGASLLPSGILKSDGEYERGALIAILNSANQTIAVGLANYSSTEINKLVGRQTSEIESILGYSSGDEIIHRNNMVRFKGVQEECE